MLRIRPGMFLHRLCSNKFEFRGGLARKLITKHVLVASSFNTRAVPSEQDVAAGWGP